MGQEDRKQSLMQMEAFGRLDMMKAETSYS